MNNEGEQIQLVFREEVRRKDLEPLCNAVLQHFNLPGKSLCCIFDDKDRTEFVGPFGNSFCGFFYPVREYGLRRLWPGELVRHVSDLDNGKAFTCDVAIYVRKTTAERPTGTAITFAHELQHFMQYGYLFKEWRANDWLKEVAVSERPDSKPWNFPTEYQAQLISKRVAEAVLGVEEVERYANEQIRSDNDPDKWTFFRGLDSSQGYDFVSETRRMVERFRPKLDALYRERTNRESEPNFTRDAWWE